MNVFILFSFNFKFDLSKGNIKNNNFIVKFIVYRFFFR